MGKKSQITCKLHTDKLISYLLSQIEIIKIVDCQNCRSKSQDYNSNYNFYFFNE